MPTTSHVYPANYILLAVVDTCPNMSKNLPFAGTAQQISEKKKPVKFLRSFPGRNPGLALPHRSTLDQTIRVLKNRCSPRIRSPCITMITETRRWFWERRVTTVASAGGPETLLCKLLATFVSECITGLTENAAGSSSRRLAGYSFSGTIPVEIVELHFSCFRDELFLFFCFSWKFFHTCKSRNRPGVRAVCIA